MTKNYFDQFDEPADKPVVGNQEIKPVAQPDPIQGANPFDEFDVVGNMKGVGGGQRKAAQSLDPNAKTTGFFDAVGSGLVRSWYGKDANVANVEYMKLVNRNAELRALLDKKFEGTDENKRIVDEVDKQFQRSWLAENEKKLAELEKERARLSKILSENEGVTPAYKQFQEANEKSDVAGATKAFFGDKGLNALSIGTQSAAESVLPTAKSLLINLGEKAATVIAARSGRGAASAPYIAGAGAVAQGSMAARDATVNNIDQNFRQYLQSKGIKADDSEAVKAYARTNPKEFKEALELAINTGTAAGVAEGAVTGGFSLVPGMVELKTAAKNPVVKFLVSKGIPFMVDSIKEGGEEAVVSGASQLASMLAGGKNNFDWSQPFTSFLIGAASGAVSSGAMDTTTGAAKKGWNVAFGGKEVTPEEQAALTGEARSTSATPPPMPGATTAGAPPVAPTAQPTAQPTTAGAPVQTSSVEDEYLVPPPNHPSAFQYEVLRDAFNTFGPDHPNTLAAAAAYNAALNGNPVPTATAPTPVAVGNVEPSPVFPGNDASREDKNEWNNAYKEWINKYGATHWNDGTPRPASYIEGTPEYAARIAREEAEAAARAQASAPVPSTTAPVATPATPAPAATAPVATPAPAAGAPSVAPGTAPVVNVGADGRGQVDYVPQHIPEHEKLSPTELTTAHSAMEPAQAANSVVALNAEAHRRTSGVKPADPAFVQKIVNASVDILLDLQGKDFNTAVRTAEGLAKMMEKQIADATQNPQTRYTQDQAVEMMYRKSFFEKLANFLKTGIGRPDPYTLEGLKQFAEGAAKKALKTALSDIGDEIGLNWNQRVKQAQDKLRAAVVPGSGVSEAEVKKLRNRLKAIAAEEYVPGFDPNAIFQGQAPAATAQPAPELTPAAPKAAVPKPEAKPAKPTKPLTKKEQKAADKKAKEEKETAAATERRMKRWQEENPNAGKDVINAYRMINEHKYGEPASEELKAAYEKLDKFEISNSENAQKVVLHPGVERYERTVFDEDGVVESGSVIHLKEGYTLDVGPDSGYQFQSFNRDEDGNFEGSSFHVNNDSDAERHLDAIIKKSDLPEITARRKVKRAEEEVNLWKNAIASVEAKVEKLRSSKKKEDIDFVTRNEAGRSNAEQELKDREQEASDLKSDYESKFGKYEKKVQEPKPEGRARAAKPSPRKGVAINGTPEGDAVIEEMKNVLKAKGFELVQMYGGKPDWNTKELHQSFKHPKGKFQIAYGMNKYTVKDNAVEDRVKVFETLDEAVRFMDKMHDVYTGVSRYSSEGPDSEIGYYVDDNFVAHGREDYADSTFLSDLKALKDMGIGIDYLVESLDSELTGDDEAGLRSIWTTLIDGKKTGAPKDIDQDAEDQPQNKPRQLGAGQGELIDTSDAFNLTGENVAATQAKPTDTTAELTTEGTEPAYVAQARTQLAKLEKSGKGLEQQKTLRETIAKYEESQKAKPAEPAPKKSIVDTKYEGDVGRKKVKKLEELRDKLEDLERDDEEESDEHKSLKKDIADLERDISGNHKDLWGKKNADVLEHVRNSIKEHNDKFEPTAEWIKNHPAVDKLFNSTKGFEFKPNSKNPIEVMLREGLSFESNDDPEAAIIATHKSFPAGTPIGEIAKFVRDKTRIDPYSSLGSQDFSTNDSMLRQRIAEIRKEMKAGKAPKNVVEAEAKPVQEPVQSEAEPVASVKDIIEEHSMRFRDEIKDSLEGAAQGTVSSDKEVNGNKGIIPKVEAAIEAVESNPSPENVQKLLDLANEAQELASRHEEKASNIEDMGREDQFMERSDLIDELNNLADTLNEMAQQLNEQLNPGAKPKDAEPSQADKDALDRAWIKQNLNPKKSFDRLNRMLDQGTITQSEYESMLKDIGVDSNGNPIEAEATAVELKNTLIDKLNSDLESDLKNWESSGGRVNNLNKKIDLIVAGRFDVQLAEIRDAGGTVEDLIAGIGPELSKHKDWLKKRLKQVSDVKPTQAEAPRTDIQGIKGLDRGIVDQQELVNEAPNEATRQARQLVLDKMKAVKEALKAKPGDNRRLETQRKKLKQLVSENVFRASRSSADMFVQSYEVKEVMDAIKSYESQTGTAKTDAERILEPFTDNEPADVTEARKQLSSIIKNMSKGEGWNAKRDAAEKLIAQFEAESTLLDGTATDETDFDIISDDALNEFMAKFTADEVGQELYDRVGYEIATREDNKERAAAEFGEEGEPVKGDLIADIEGIIASSGGTIAIPTLPAAFGHQELLGLAQQLGKARFLKLARLPKRYGKVDAKRAETDLEYKKNLKDAADGMLSDLAQALASRGWTQVDPTNANTDVLIDLIARAANGETLTPQGGVGGVAAQVDMPAEYGVKRLYTPNEDVDTGENPFSRRDVNENAPLVDAAESLEARRLGSLFETRNMREFIGDRKVVPQTADEGFADFIKNFRNGEIDQRTALMMLDEMAKDMFGGLDRQTKRIRLKELNEKAKAAFEKANPGKKGLFAELPDRRLKEYLPLSEYAEAKRLENDLSQPVPKEKMQSDFTAKEAYDFAEKIKKAKEWVQKANPQYNDFTGYIADNVPMREYYQHAVYSKKFRTGEPVAVVGVHGTYTSQGFIKDKRYSPEVRVQDYPMEAGERRGAYFASSDATVLNPEYQGYDPKKLGYEIHPGFRRPESDSPNVAKSVIVFDNPLVVNGQFADIMKRTEKILGEAIAAGHDGVIYINQTDGGNLDVSFIIPVETANKQQRMIGSTLDKSMAGGSYDPLPRGEGLTSGTDVLSRRDISPDAAKRELERRQKRNAENRAGDPEGRKGYAGIIARVTDELRLRGGLTPKQIEGVTRIMNKIGSQFFEDVKMRINKGKEGELGQYDAIKRIVSIFAEAVESGRFEETAAHEIAHHITRFLPEADRLAIIKEMREKRADFLKANKGLETLFDANDQNDWAKLRFTAQQVAAANLQNPTKHLVKLTSEELKKGGYKPGESIYRLRLTDETYRLTKADEYFAEEFKDSVMRELNSDPVYLGRSRNWKEKLAGLWETIKVTFRQLFGKDIANRILKNFAKGRYNADLEGGVSVGGRGSDVSPVLSERDRARKANPVTNGNMYPIGEAFVRQSDGSTDVVNILGRNKMSPERAAQMKDFVKDSKVKHALYRGQAGAYEVLDPSKSRDGLFHVAQDPDYAAQYADDYSGRLPEGGTDSVVAQVYVNVKNVLDLTKYGHTISDKNASARIPEMANDIANQIAGFKGLDPIRDGEQIADLKAEILSALEHEFLNHDDGFGTQGLNGGNVWRALIPLSKIVDIFGTHGVDAVKYSDSDFRTAKGEKRGGKEAYAIADPTKIKAAYGENDVNPDSGNIFQARRDDDGNFQRAFDFGEGPERFKGKDVISEKEFNEAKKDPKFNEGNWELFSTTLPDPGVSVEEAERTGKKARDPLGDITTYSYRRKPQPTKMTDPAAETKAQDSLPKPDEKPNPDEPTTFHSIRDASEEQSEDPDLFSNPRKGASGLRVALDVITLRYFSGISAKAHQNASRFSDSKVMKRIANIIHARPGTESNAFERDMPTAISVARSKFNNKLNKIMEPLRDTLGGFKDTDQGSAQEQREEVYRALTDMITGRRPLTGGAIGKAAVGLKQLFAQMHQYRTDAGEKIGTIEDYFPAVYNSIFIGENRTAFIKDAKEAYILTINELGEEEIAKLLEIDVDSYNDMLAVDPEAIEDSIAEIAEEKAKELYNMHVRGAAAESFDSIFGKGQSNQESPLLSRKFGKEAQDIMRKWQVNDPFRVVGRYISSAVRRTEVVRRFGADGKKWSGFSKAMEKDGIPYSVILETADLVKKAAGIELPVRGKAAQSYIDTITLVTAASAMGKGFMNNLVEPISIGIRAGSVGATLRAYAETWSRFLREVAALSPALKAKMGDTFWTQYGNEIGTIHNSFEDAWMTTHSIDMDAENADPRFRWLTNRIYKANLMDASETAKQQASHAIGFSYINRVAELFSGNHWTAKLGLNAKQSATDNLNELGIPPSKHDEFSAWCQQLAAMDDANRMAAMTGESEMSQLHQEAMIRFSMQSSVRTNRAHKPVFQDTELGKTYLQLMNFSYAYAAEVNSRLYDMIKRALMVSPPGKDYSLYDRLRMIAPIVIGALSIAAYRGLLELKDMIYPTESAKQRAKDPAVVKWINATSYAGLLGPKFEMIMKTIKRDQAPGGPTGQMAVNVGRAGKSALEALAEGKSMQQSKVTAAKAGVPILKSLAVAGASGINPVLGAAAVQVTNSPQIMGKLIPDKNKGGLTPDDFRPK